MNKKRVWLELPFRLFLKPFLKLSHVFSNLVKDIDNDELILHIKEDARRDLERQLSHNTHDHELSEFLKTPEYFRFQSIEMFWNWKGNWKLNSRLVFRFVGVFSSECRCFQMSIILNLNKNPIRRIRSARIQIAESRSRRNWACYCRRTWSV